MCPMELIIVFMVKKLDVILVINPESVCAFLSCVLDLLITKKVQFFKFILKHSQMLTCYSVIQE
jgi:hypothetical protein